MVSFIISKFMALWQVPHFLAHILAKMVFKWRKNCFLLFTFIKLFMIFLNLFHSPMQLQPSFINMLKLERTENEQIFENNILNYRYLVKIMRILVQRVFESWVKVGGVQISRIKEGLLVLVGITHDDNADVADHMISKILNMRLWQKQGKSWNGTVMEIGGEIMVVSQFTLYGILKGNKPDFHASMQADKAKNLFNYVVDQLKQKYDKERIQTGKFQALMEVGSVINGPVTIQYEKSAQDMPKKKSKPIPPGKKQEEIPQKDTKSVKQQQSNTTSGEVAKKQKDQH